MRRLEELCKPAHFARGRSFRFVGEYLLPHFLEGQEADVAPG
jgi:hypothetical protein